jgi:predicted Rossmann fold flavoprotein
MSKKPYHTIIIGAGAAGLMCAIESGKQGHKTLIIDHAKKPAQKIRISGGGRCNFTNLHTTHENFLSQNPHFCKSALTCFTQHDFIKLVEKHNIAYHEKTLGQLFCDGSSAQIIDMLLKECEEVNVEILLETTIDKITKSDNIFTLTTNSQQFQSNSLVVACGGPSIPKMGATSFAYQIARQFGLNIIKPRAALVPFLLDDALLQKTKLLAGVAVPDVIVTCANMQFREAMLFTHRGLSGPVILQISSYQKEGDSIKINFTPDIDVLSNLKSAREQNPKQELQTFLNELLPKKLSSLICEQTRIYGKLADLSNKKLETIAKNISSWQITPSGTEGYRTAEVTRGGIDTRELSSQTFESKKVQNLYFIGESLDVTGHLGGHNFQWAWSSGYCCGSLI